MAVSKWTVLLVDVERDRFDTRPDTEFKLLEGTNVSPWTPASIYRKRGTVKGRDGGVAMHVPQDAVDVLAGAMEGRVALDGHRLVGPTKMKFGIRAMPALILGDFGRVSSVFRLFCPYDAFYFGCRVAREFRVCVRGRFAHTIHADLPIRLARPPHCDATQNVDRISRCNHAGLRAAQVDRNKTRVERANGFSALKLQCDEPLSSFAYNDLRRYSLGIIANSLRTLADLGVPSEGTPGRGGIANKLLTDVVYTPEHIHLLVRAPVSAFTLTFNQGKDFLYEYFTIRMSILP